MKDTKCPDELNSLNLKAFISIETKKSHLL